MTQNAVSKQTQTTVSTSFINNNSPPKLVLLQNAYQFLPAAPQILSSVVLLSGCLRVVPHCRHNSNECLHLPLTDRQSDIWFLCVYSCHGKLGSSSELVQIDYQLSIQPPRLLYSLYHPATEQAKYLVGCSRSCHVFSFTSGQSHHLLFLRLPADQFFLRK
jgi:hypothetical protein